MLFTIGNVFYTTVDDHIGYANLRERTRSLFAQLNAVCEYQYFFVALLNILSGYFRKYDRLTATGGQLIKHIVVFGIFFKTIKYGINCFFLVIVQLFFYTFFFVF